jgi:hypothetical protein
MKVGHAEQIKALGACLRMPFPPNSSEFSKNNARR